MMASCVTSAAEATLSSSVWYGERTDEAWPRSEESRALRIGATSSPTHETSANLTSLGLGFGFGFG